MMAPKYLWSSIMFVVLAEITAQEYALGTPVGRALVPTCQETGVVCQTCSVLLTCSDTQPELRQQCAAIDPNQPFCNEGKCSSTPDPDCAGITTPFDCSGDGFFPDPMDCTMYYSCDAGVATPMRCPAGYVYYSQSLLCRRRNNNNCQIFRNCNGGNNGKLIPFQPNPNYYGYCRTGPPRFIKVYKCADTEIFDVSIRACRFNCRANGQFTDVSNCMQYHQCNRRGNRWIESTLTCPPDTFFNGVRCAQGDCP